MNVKVKLYLLNFFLFFLLFFTLFEPNIISKIGLAIILSIYTFICYRLIKNHKTVSIYSKQVNFLFLLLALIYLIGFYCIGIFSGFYKSTIQFSLWSIINYITPITIIIICSEFIRFKYVFEKEKILKVTNFISLVLIVLFLYSTSYNLNNLNDFLIVIGFILFSSISYNLLYNYLSIRYGIKGIIIYKLITSLYIYIIPITPNLYIYFKTIIRIVYPYLIYLIVDNTYERKFKVVNKKDRKNILIYIIFLTFMVLTTMLISCKFKYGMIVIGSGSMTGTLNKGDAVIYKRFENQTLSKGQIIIFTKDDIKIIHRIIDIKVVNSQMRYYTKGDNNVAPDDFYVTDEDVVGIVEKRIMFIGYPSVLLKEMFN